MKILIMVSILLTNIFASVNEMDRTYMTVGDIPDNIKLVCIEGTLHAQQKENGYIYYSLLYKYNKVTGTELPVTCN